MITPKVFLQNKLYNNHINLFIYLDTEWRLY